MEERVDAYRVLVGKPEEKRLLRRPGGNWEDIKKISERDSFRGFIRFRIWAFGGML
jgi:hypothetical protein